MPPDKILVLITSLFGIIFVYWFFLIKRDKEVVVTSDSIDILVNGGYDPDFITISKGKTTRINFFRTDPSTCLEEVILSDFKIRKYLPVDQKVSIEVTPQKTGEFPFSCGMHMFHGKLKVV